ncbi:hypothetical protein L6452_02698 [Arctium lappa]|uniref:Uncharacterized protein n=1 Tax=Arctium lappa TaxID=4217 RepID=A0ACB9FJJ5_ARCLA|nr:hypothetical protein L6452_02698 [Arctium lappa]
MLKLDLQKFAYSAANFSEKSKIYREEKKVLKEKVNALKKINEDLRKQIFDSQHLTDGESIKDKKQFEKKFSDLSKKSIEEKKVLELKCLKLSQQVSNFEKVIILERDQFAKEKKAFDQNNVGFLKEILDGRKGAKKEFEEERSTFEAAIRKLTEKLSVLSKCALREKKKKCELETKIDLIVKERNSN